MQTREILTIIALSVLGLCLLVGLGKSMTKNPKKKMDCDKACGMLFFVSVVLLAVSQLLGETEKMSWPNYITGVGQGGLGEFGVYTLPAEKEHKHMKKMDHHQNHKCQQQTPAHFGAQADLVTI